MRKVIGVVLAVLMCVSMCAGFAFASTGTGALSSLLGDIDLSDYSDGELAGLVDGLANVDIGGLLLGGSAQDTADAVAADIDEMDIEGSITNGIFGVLAGLIGTENAEKAEDILEEDNDTLDDALKGLNENNSDEFVNVVSGVFENFGLSDVLGDFSLGEFDLGSVVDSVLAGSSSGSGTPTDEVASNDFMAGIADTLLGGLQAIGIDTTVIEGLLDNEIVNFFANLYCGWNTGKKDEPTEPTTIEITTTAPTTQPPIHVKTGDTSSVMVAIGTLSVAAAAAFVCMKKKRA